MVSGSVVVEKLAYDGGRPVSVYLPSSRPTAVVFAADGEEVAEWGETLEGAGIPSTAIVGVHGLPDEMQRLEEYSPGFNAERFAAHETFFFHDVRRGASQRFDIDLPPERTAVFGASAGGELALALGLRHPDTYGTILSGRRERDFTLRITSRRRCRAPTSWPELRSPSSWPTQIGGPVRWETPEPTSSSSSATPITDQRCGGRSFL